MPLLFISLATTIKNRLDFLKVTLPTNLRDNSGYADLEFVITDYNCQQGTRQWVFDTFRDHIKSGRIRYIWVPDAGEFHTAHCKNICSRHSRGEIVCNLDADNLTSTGFPFYLNEVFTKHNRIFAASRLGTSVAGRIAMRKTDFAALNGYDETLTGWGYEDDDIKIRGERIGLRWEFIPPRFCIAIPHSDELRGKDIGRTLRHNMTLASRREHITQDWGRARVIEGFPVPF
jgi:hypothetical protein